MLHSLAGFLAALTHADADGRIIHNPAAGSAMFVLLNAAARFQQVSTSSHTWTSLACSTCHAIIDRRISTELGL